MSSQPPAEGQQHGHSGGFFSKLRSTAAEALAKVPQYNEMEHYVRQASVQANPRQSPHTLHVQLAIKGCKGVMIDHDAVARETKNFSKNILDFARLEGTTPGNDVADIQDVGDRIAFLVYKAGELHEQHAKRLETSRIALKDIRNYDNTLTPQRDQRAQLEREIGKLRVSAKPDTSVSRKIDALQADLDKVNAGLAKGEDESISLKRRLMAESFDKQFESLQELGEKLAIIAGYGRALVKGWDSSSPSAGKTDYVDGARTASVRSGVESALGAWDAKHPVIPLPTLKPGASAHTAPSFHETHAGELASLHSVHDPVAAHQEALNSYYNQPSTPPVTTGHYSQSATGSGAAAPVAIPGAAPTPPSSSSIGHTTSSASPLIQQLNTAPVTSLPPSSSPAAGGTHISPELRSVSSGSGAAPLPIPTSPGSSSLTPAPSLPTVAETGAPIVGTGGPAKGVLRPPSEASGSGAAAAQAKQEEARQDLNRRFEEYSGHGSGVASGSGVDLDRDLSLRGKQGEEQLPAYSNEQSKSTQEK